MGEVNLILTNKKLLITGGTGFIGKNILDYIIENKINLTKLTLVTRNVSKFKQNYVNFNLLNNVDFIETDVCDLKYNGESYDYIIHAATNVVEQTEGIKLSTDIVKGTTKVLEFAVSANIAAFINFSSGAVYGKFSHLENISELQNPEFNINDTKSTYGMSKLYGEHLVYLYADKYQFKAISLRCFAFAGKYLNYNHYAIGDFISRVINNQNIVVNAGKNIYRSYLAIEELIEWMFSLVNYVITNNKTYDIYNIGSDKAISLPDLAYKVKDVLQSDIKISCPNYENDTIMYYVPSIDKISNVGRKVKTNLDDLIIFLASHYRKNLHE
ncbi:MAG: NAD(P)-dependent oxidoreductase [Burkholderiales bacterium]|nr:NAD(P)-dependent oxidoreductase [Burkholderiales bacterium]